jgi:NAD(P)H-dependent flavin oxidoreductase YrpB (nitropropane dioxygenase family)
LLRTPFTDRLARDGGVARLLRSARSAAAFRRLTGASWGALLREGMQMRQEHGLPLGQVLLAANTPALLRAAMVDGRPEFGVMATGQVAGIIDDLPSCAELIERIIAEAEAILAGFAVGAGEGTARHGISLSDADGEQP